MLINIGLITEFVALIIRPSLVMLPSERSKDFKYQWCGVAWHGMIFGIAAADLILSNGQMANQQKSNGSRATTAMVK